MIRELVMEYIISYSYDEYFVQVEGVFIDQFPGAITQSTDKMEFHIIEDLVYDLMNEDYGPFFLIQTLITLEVGKDI